jgi:membrane associated rhomboid family serine protease
MFTIFIIFGFLWTGTGVSQAGYKTDYLGHLGGCLTGFFYGFAFFPRVPTPGGKKWKTIGFVTLALWFSILLGTFYGGAVKV